MSLPVDTDARDSALLLANAARVSASKRPERAATDASSDSSGQIILDAGHSLGPVASNFPAPGWRPGILRDAALSMAQSFAGAWREKRKSETTAVNLAEFMERGSPVARPARAIAQTAPWHAGDIRVSRRRDRLIDAMGEKLVIGRAHVDNQVLKVASAVSAAPKLASAGATISNAILPALGLSAAHPALFAGQVLGSTAAVVWLAVEGKGLAQSVWARRSRKDATPPSMTQDAIDAATLKNAPRFSEISQASIAGIEVDAIRGDAILSGLSGLKRRLVSARSASKNTDSAPKPSARASWP